MPTETRTVLQELARIGFPMKLLYDAASAGYYMPIAKLILNSTAIAERADAEWSYKSLAEYGEESFARHGRVHARDHTDADWKGWEESAVRSFCEAVCVNAWFEENEGLIFYVRSEQGNFREAQRGDAAYDFMDRLRADQSLSDLRFVAPPSWARELFIERTNKRLHSLMWNDCSSTGDSDYRESKKLKSDAVHRETRRLMSPTATAEGGVYTKDVVRLIDIAKCSVQANGLTAHEASSFVIERVQASDVPLYFHTGESVNGPFNLQGTSGRYHAQHLLCLASARWWEPQPLEAGRDLEIATALALHVDAATDLFGPALLPAADQLGDSAVYPPDLPAELDAALLAFQALSNGYGDPSSTPRNRLVAWLSQHYGGLGTEAIQRIATVANPDKTTGRKTRRQD